MTRLGDRGFARCGVWDPPFSRRRNSRSGVTGVAAAGKKAHVGKVHGGTTTESRPGRDNQAEPRTAATRDERDGRQLFLGTRKLDPAVLRTDAPTASKLLRKRPTASLGLAERLVSGSFETQERGEDFRLEAARASSCNLTGTAEGFVHPRGGVTLRCQSSVEPVTLPSRRGERKSFWGVARERRKTIAAAAPTAEAKAAGVPTP